MLVRKTLKAEAAYLQSLESSDMFSGASNANVNSEDSNGKKSKSKDKKAKSANPAHTPQAAALKACIAGLTALHGKLNGDIPFAKRDIAYGKLSAKDLDEIFTRLRAILIPLVGISTITDIFERLAERRGWVQGEDPKNDRCESWERSEASTREEEVRVWNSIMKALHEPFAIAAAASEFLGPAYQAAYV